MSYSLIMFSMDLGQVSTPYYLNVHMKDLLPDAFAEARTAKGHCPFLDQDDEVTMLLRLKNVRKAAHNHKTFHSGAKPGRIVVPSEVNIRDIRQIPFEVDPPEHTEYRGILEDWFRRPLDDTYERQLTELINQQLDKAITSDITEVIEEFSLPLQSKALTLLLNIQLDEAETWINWGTHVFRSESSSLDGDKAAILYDYIDNEIDKSIATPGDDLYSVLLDSKFQGRRLTKEEVKGVMILIFAGGRDTIINAIANTVAYFAEYPESLVQLEEQPEIISRATEELIRYFSPLTHMGRVVTEDVDISGHAAKTDSRISLCWASANRDQTVFEKPNEIILNRKLNPHVGFGFGIHKCLGAPHARQIMKVLLRQISKRVSSIEIITQEENIEDWGAHQRKVGYNNLTVRFKKR